MQVLEGSPRSSSFGNTAASTRSWKPSTPPSEEALLPRCVVETLSYAYPEGIRVLTVSSVGVKVFLTSATIFDGFRQQRLGGSFTRVWAPPDHFVHAWLQAAWKCCAGEKVAALPSIIRTPVRRFQRGGRELCRDTFRQTAPGQAQRMQLERLFVDVKSWTAAPRLLLPPSSFRGLVVRLTITLGAPFGAFSRCGLGGRVLRKSSSAGRLTFGCRYSDRTAALAIMVAFARGWDAEKVDEDTSR